MNKLKIQCIDLFCGGGGFSHGFIQGGGKIVLAVDNWEKALQFHELNHPGVKTMNYELGGNIEEFARILESYIDRTFHFHLHGSPPCQELSNASNHKSSDGYVMVKWFLRLVEYMKPNSWSMENVLPVSHFLDKDSIPYVKLNSANFGVPQTRKRVFAGEGWNVKETHRKEEWVSVIDALPHLEGELKIIVNKKIKPRTINEPIRSITSKLPSQIQIVSRHKKKNQEPQFYNLNEPSHTITSLKQQIYTNINIEDFQIECQGSGSKRSLDSKLTQPSKTICGSGNLGGMRIFLNPHGFTTSNSSRSKTPDRELTKPSNTIVHLTPTIRKEENGNYERIRSLTIEETLILQGWHDCKIPEINKNDLFKIVGNMVCPPISKAICEGIILNHKIDFEKSFTNYKFEQITLF